MSEPIPPPSDGAPPPPAAPAETPGLPQGAARAAPETSAQGMQPWRSALPVLTVIGFIFVLLGLAWIWNGQTDIRLRVAELSVPPPPAVEPSRVAALEARVKVLEQRLGDLENRPPPPAPPPSFSSADAAALSSQLTDLEQRLKGAEQRQGRLAAQAALAQRVQQAEAALEAGQPLGDLPGAPPVLAQFARKKPPTEAELRLAFPAAAEAAEAASRPSVAGRSLGERILLHVGSLFTVREGNHVLIGTPATTVLGEAQARLEAGDLAGTLAALEGLDGAATQAMADWRGEAQTLLDARAALAKMAHG